MLFRASEWLDMEILKARKWFYMGPARKTP